MGRPKGSKNKVSSTKTTKKVTKKSKTRKPRSDIGVSRKAKGVVASPILFKEEMVKKLSNDNNLPSSTPLPTEQTNVFQTMTLPVVVSEDGYYKVGDLVEKKPECIVGIECIQGKVVCHTKGSNFVRVEWKDHSSFCVHKDTIKLR